MARRDGFRTVSYLFDNPYQHELTFPVMPQTRIHCGPLLPSQSGHNGLGVGPHAVVSSPRVKCVDAEPHKTVS